MFLLARAVRAAIAPRASSTAFAAVDVAGGGGRISAFLPRRDLTGDASSNGGVPAVHSGDSTGVPPAASLHPRTCNELEKNDLQTGENIVLEGKKATSYLDFDEKDLESDEALWALYERWCKFQGIQRSYSEMARRFHRFKYVAHFVHTSNNDYLPYELGLGKFADQEISEVCGPSLYNGSP